MNVKHNINKMDNKHMIISIYAKKSFNKFQHPFMTKILKKLDIKGMYFNTIKAISDKLSANIFSGGTLEVIPLRSET